ncbi:hypothetical protein KI809_04355 [Geobacter pelophilus]|uniref:Uncharacterized protein n=1 Tax=Geoanaerobacter pelophilus TaxID=60036 RepID=A0AAW4KY18_9BACT|nr:hypothetical protein [Geoanaerobacter pelophilus]MBT0663528.1 hypothetical protein [Geoanaerobacter pelophilus]
MLNWMVSYKIELVDREIIRGTVAVPAVSREGAHQTVVALIRGHHDEKYSRPDVFSGFDPRDVDDISVVVLGPA